MAEEQATNADFFGKIASNKYTVPIIIGAGVVAIGIVLLVTSKPSNGITPTPIPPNGTTPTPLPPTPTPGVPLYSVLTPYTSSCTPYIWKGASRAQWDTLASLTESYFKQNNYHGDGEYIANFAGEIIVHRGPIKPTSIVYPYSEVEGLASWIKSGGIYIDYCGYPMYYDDCQVWWFGTTSPGATGRWNYFCDKLGVTELSYPSGAIVQSVNSNFFSQKPYAEFQFDRSLNILKSMPSRSKMVTSNMVSSLQKVPFILNSVYSMFALRSGNGFYAYSNPGNSPANYATFLKAVHANLI